MQTQRVAVDSRRQVEVAGYLEAESLELSRPGDEADSVVDHSGKCKGAPFNGKFARIEFGEIEDIIDEPEQVRTGVQDAGKGGVTGASDAIARTDARDTQHGVDSIYPIPVPTTLRASYRAQFNRIPTSLPSRNLHKYRDAIMLDCRLIVFSRGFPQCISNLLPAS